MTESIFAPFRLTTEDSVRKLVEVLESPVTPLPRSDSTAHFLTKEEGIRFFEERKKRSEQQ